MQRVGPEAARAVQRAERGRGAVSAPLCFEPVHHCVSLSDPRCALFLPVARAERTVSTVGQRRKRTGTSAEQPTWPPSSEERSARWCKRWNGHAHSTHTAATTRRSGDLPASLTASQQESAAPIVAAAAAHQHIRPQTPHNRPAHSATHSSAQWRGRRMRGRGRAGAVSQRSRARLQSIRAVSVVRKTFRFK